MNDKVFKDFPQLNNDFVYFDTAATSLKPWSVINAVNDYNSKLSANINRGMYHQSIEATRAYEETRVKVAQFINAKPEEVIFTRGTTSSLNLVAQVYGLTRLDKDSEIIISEQEHHSMFLPWQNVAQKTGAKLRFIELDATGRITIAAFKKVLTSKTKVVAINYVSNVLGYINPIKEMIALAHEVGAVVVVDGAQAVQHLKVDVKKLDADFFAFSGHKMLGPTGVGVLYGKSHILNVLEPFEFGGDMNDDVEKNRSTWKKPPYKFEAGTMPIAEVIGLGKAVDYINEIGLDNIDHHTKNLYDYFISELEKVRGVTIYNKGSEVGIITFNLDNVPSHDAISFYAEQNIALRSGQHCAKLIHDFLGINSSLRVSVYIYNSIEEINKFIKFTKAAVEYFHSLGF